MKLLIEFEDYTGSGRWVIYPVELRLVISTCLGYAGRVGSWGYDNDDSNPGRGGQDLAASWAWYIRSLRGKTKASK